MISLVLPFPVSINALYAGRGRRHKSKRYKKWILEAQNALWSQQWKPLADAPLQITYRFGQPDNRQRDVFNLEKCVSDFLVDQQVISDDSMIHRGIVEWGEQEGIVEIEIVYF